MHKTPQVITLRILKIDILRIAEAIASEIKGGHMAGPFPIGYIKNANRFISVVKSDGSRRQGGNLSALREGHLIMESTQEYSKNGRSHRPHLGISLTRF